MATTTVGNTDCIMFRGIAYYSCWNECWKKWIHIFSHPTCCL